MKQFKIVSVVMDVSLTSMQRGLLKLCDKNGIKFWALPHGSSVIFVNKRRNYIKLLVANNSGSPIVVAYRMPTGVPFSLRVAEVIARAFDGTAANPSKVLQSIVMRHLKAA